MRNDYLTNKAKFNNLKNLKKKINKDLSKQEILTPKKTVNVNILLNKVKLDEKKTILEKVILFGVVIMLISITGVVTFL
tara:strand:- start:466 stop:702 length:237 start_codon:yes stop_codon:yes gene_type:complete